MLTTVVDLNIKHMYHENAQVNIEISPVCESEKGARLKFVGEYKNLCAHSSYSVVVSLKLQQRNY